MQIHRVDTIASTSLYLRQQIQSGQIVGPTALVALEQSGGIGQFGRPWFSPRGGLWFSVALPLQHAQGTRPLSDYIAGDATRTPLGTRLGTSCLHALSAFLCASGHALDLRLKPPNDVLLITSHQPDGAKIAGILTEVITSPNPTATWLLVGVGINTNVPAGQLPTGLTYPAATLLAHLGEEIDNDTLLESVLRAVVDAAEPAAT